MEKISNSLQKNVLWSQTKKGKNPKSTPSQTKLSCLIATINSSQDLWKKIHLEIAKKVLQKRVFVLPSCVVVSGVMYTLKPLQNQILKLEIFTELNWILLCLVSSHMPWGYSLKGKKKEKRTSSRFSDPMKGLSLLFPIYKQGHWLMWILTIIHIFPLNLPRSSQNRKLGCASVSSQWHDRC